MTLSHGSAIGLFPSDGTSQPPSRHGAACSDRARRSHVTEAVIYLLDSNVVSELWKQEPAPSVVDWMASVLFGMAGADCRDCGNPRGS